MLCPAQNFSFAFNSERTIDMKRTNTFLVLFFVSAAVFAQANGIVKLPESYRTPLSDMVYDDQKEWRTEAKDENPWRENGEDTAIKPRIKLELFPQYNYDSLYFSDSTDDPRMNPTIHNETEIQRPVSNILEYSF